MSNELTIVLGLETTVRELDARLVLASLHARRGHRIFIAGGLSAQRLVRDLEGAVFVGKHIIHPTSEDPQAYFLAKKNGFVVVHLAEEGGVFMGTEKDWTWDLDDQLHPHMLDPEDFVCTWGDFQRDHYRTRSAPNPANIRTTGHPRFDICKAGLRGFYEEEAAVLRQKYGNFVLWCSNFGLANDPEGPFNTFSKMLGYTPEDDQARLRFIGRWGHQYRTFAEFIELFHKLSVRRPDINFVVRPHPSDNVEFFRCAFRGVDNVKVTQEGTVAPWLIASRAMLHDGCTTGLEAYMLGTPIVNFRPLQDTPQSFYLPNLFGAHCKTQESAIEAVESALSDGAAIPRQPAEELPERAHRIFANFRNDSIGRFLEVLREAEALAQKRARTTSRRRFLATEARFIANEESRHLVRRVLFPARYRTAMHSRQRFPGFDRASIRKKLARLHEMTGNRLDCKFHSPNILELTSDRTSP